MSQPAPDDHAHLTRLAGGRVVAADRAPWGFSNHTDLVTLDDGRRLAVQRLRDPGQARHRLRVSALLDDRLRSAGVPVPRLVAGGVVDGGVPPAAGITGAEGSRWYAVTERVEGAPGNTLLDDPLDAIALATEMGRLARTIASVDVADVRLPETWAHPARLATLAGRWLTAVRPALGPTTAALADRLVARIEPALAGRPGVLAHGDWAPVNVLVRGRAVVGVVDWEHARLADPLFDIAWWAWVVWHHHPERYPAAAPALFETAGVPLEAATVERMRLLVATRLLEAAGGTGSLDDAARTRWVERLRELLHADG